MDTLFGTEAQEMPSQQASGYTALPDNIQGRFDEISNLTQNLYQNPDQYFRPMGMTPQEQFASQLIDPRNMQQSIGYYLNPFQDIIQQDINRQFEAPQGALASQISEAGAFGGSRARGAQADLERARLDALSRASADQYNNAFGQMQQGIGNLLGFGGFERGLDLQQRQALPKALQTSMGILQPLLSSSTGTGGYIEAGESGLVEDVGRVGQLAGTAMAFFSDIRLKNNINLVGNQNGHNIYEFSYRGNGKKYRGVMAQEVIKKNPDAVVLDDSGYYRVYYNKLGLKMEAV